MQVLVGKTLEQSLMEVLEEEELANMRAHQDEYDHIRAAELAEAQRMEEAEKRRYEERERRMDQERRRIDNERAMAKKIAARGFSHRYVCVSVCLWVGGFCDGQYGCVYIRMKTCAEV